MLIVTHEGKPKNNTENSWVLLYMQYQWYHKKNSLILFKQNMESYNGIVVGQRKKTLLPIFFKLANEE